MFSDPVVCELAGGWMAAAIPGEYHHWMFAHQEGFYVLHLILVLCAFLSQNVDACLLWKFVERWLFTQRL